VVEYFKPVMVMILINQLDLWSRLKAFMRENGDKGTGLIANTSCHIVT